MRTPLAPFAIGCMLALGCRSTGSGGGWKSEVVADLGVKLGGCAVGDLDPERPGNEIAVVGASGAVWVVSTDGEAWSHELAAQTPGELVQCAIGDVDPGHEGEELVAVGVRTGTEDGGGRGVVRVVKRVAGGWHVDTIFEDPALLHAVCIADLDPGEPGSEILVAGLGGVVHVLGRDGTGWKATSAGTLHGAGKSATAFEGGAAIAARDGTVVFVGLAPEGWQERVLDRAAAGQARIGAHDATLVVARDDGVLALIDEGGRREIYREAERLRGAVLAELDPRTPGIEVATAGYSGQITVLTWTEDGYEASVVARDPEPFHHLTAGELPGRGAGIELVGCGYSGKLHVVGRAR